MIFLDPRSGEYVTLDLPSRPAERLGKNAIPVRTYDRAVGSRPAPQPPAPVNDRTSPERAVEPPPSAGHADAIRG
jgi:hypothetical protein